MGVLSSFKSLFAVQQIADRPALRAFLESRAAYLVQKSITEYSQARANLLFSTLMREKLFIDSYERARWLSYPAAISMVTEMAEGMLRGHAGIEPGRLDAALTDMVQEIVARYPGPSGEGEAFWFDAVEQVRRDLAQAALAPPRPVRDIPVARAEEIFVVLPVNAQLRQHDFPMFRNTLRFHLTAIGAEFEERADPERLVAQLSA